MLAKQWLNNTREIMSRIEETQMENINKAAKLMADTIEAGQMGSYIWMRACYFAHRRNVSTNRWVCWVSSDG